MSEGERGGGKGETIAQSKQANPIPKTCYIHTSRPLRVIKTSLHGMASILRNIYKVVILKILGFTQLFVLIQFILIIFEISSIDLLIKKVDLNFFLFLNTQ